MEEPIQEPKYDVVRVESLNGCTLDKLAKEAGAMRGWHGYDPETGKSMVFFKGEDLTLQAVQDAMAVHVPDPAPKFPEPKETVIKRVLVALADGKTPDAEDVNTLKE